MNYYLIFLIIFSWQGLFFGAHQKSLDEKNFLSLPNDVHQMIAESMFDHDVASFASDVSDIDQVKRHFSFYDYFIKKGFFPPNPFGEGYPGPQNFNNFCCLNKSFFAIAHSISYDSKLKIWYEKRIVLSLEFEERLFKQLLQRKADKISIISTALNFFEHPNLKRSICYKKEKYNLFFEWYISCSPVKSKEPVLSDFPFVGVIFYAYVLILYKKLNSHLKLQSSNDDDTIKMTIERSSVFRHTNNCDFNWFEKFICFSLCLLKEHVLNKPSIDKNILEKVSRLEASFKESFMCEMKPLSKEKRLLSLIDHYSILTIQDHFDLFLKKNWLKIFPLEEQKIIWFYYANVLYKRNISLSKYPCFDFPELLAEIKEWLEDTYSGTFILSDVKAIKFDFFWFKEKIFLLLGYLVKNATIENVFDANLFFKVLKPILNFEESFVNIINNTNKEDEATWDENFFEALSQKCFKAFDPENKKHNANNTLDNQSSEKLVNKDNASPSKEVEPQNYNKSTNDPVIKNPTGDDDLGKGKQSTHGRLKKIVFYCVASVIAYCSLYTLWYHVKNYKHHYG
jgi:hypothetical protein